MLFSFSLTIRNNVGSVVFFENLTFSSPGALDLRSKGFFDKRVILPEIHYIQINI